MENKALDLICSRLEAVLEKQGFKKQKDKVQEEKGEAVLFVGETTAYSVLYNAEGKMFELRSTAMTDEGPEDSDWKSISNWIFDPETDTNKEAESIANDFCDTVDDSKRRAIVRAAQRKKAKQEGDDSPGPVFFYKRLVGVFPDLRDAIAEEDAAYEEFRAVTFAKNEVVPRVDELARKKGSTQLKKICQLMEDFHKTGDLDVRSIITMVIMNGVSAESRANMLELMGPEFCKFYHRCEKYIGKEVRPEKPKTAKKKKAGYIPEDRLSSKPPREYRKK